MAAVYSIRESDLSADAETVMRLWTDNFPAYTPQRAQAKLRLGYLDNPAGRGAGLLLQAEGAAQAAGVQCLHPRSFHLGERRLHAANLADYTVDTAHRSLGPALMLMKRSVELGRQRYDLVYGIPNKNSAAVCLRAGLLRIGVLTRYALVLSSRPYLSRRLPASLAVPLGTLADLGLVTARAVRHRFQTARLRARAGSFDAGEVDDAWRQRPAELMLSDRSARMLRWRYADPARGSWQLCLLRDATDRPAGHVVWQLKDTVAEVSDFYSPQPERMTQPLMLAFKRHARRLGATSVSLEFLGSPAIVAALQSVGFRPRAEGAIVFRGKSDAFDALTESNWYFTGFDNDAD